MKHFLQLNHPLKRNTCSDKGRYYPNLTRDISTHATDADVHLEKDQHPYHDAHWDPLNLMDASADTDGYPLLCIQSLVVGRMVLALSDTPLMPEECHGRK